MSRGIKDELYLSRGMEMEASSTIGIATSCPDSGGAQEGEPTDSVDERGLAVSTRQLSK